MLKPKRLKKGDRVAIVSLSKGMLGEEKFIHILDIARARLEGDYSFEVTVIAEHLKGHFVALRPSRGARRGPDERLY